jgi:site-specific recombinase XerD
MATIELKAFVERRRAANAVADEFMAELEECTKLMAEAHLADLADLTDDECEELVTTLYKAEADARGLARAMKAELAKKARRRGRGHLTR